MASNSLRGYKLLPGSGRRYRTPSGRIISRRAYDNKRAQAAGFRNRYELERFRLSIQGSGWLGDIYSHTGHPPTWEDYALIKDVQARRRALTALYGEGTHSELDYHDPELVAPDGPLAQLLDRAGKRNISGRPVGTS